MPSKPEMILQHHSPGLKTENAVATPAGDGREFICGWGAASINILTTFPINKVIFRQQLLGISATTALRDLKAEGMLTLYRGILPPLMQKTVSLSLMFGMYDKFNKICRQNFTDCPPVLRKTTSAILAGCCEAVLTPFERVQTLLQDKFYHERYRNTFHAFRELRNWGFFEYYRGLTPILLRNGPSNAVFFLFRGEIKDLLPESDRPSVEVLRNFASGAVLGAVISTIFFPLNVVKNRMQRKVGGEFIGCYKSFLFVYNERNRSLRAVFRGARFNYMRALISWGIINASYEFLKSHIYPDIS